jgi:hypothetical protein
MATQADIDGLIRRFRDVDAVLATLGDREVTYSTQTSTRTEPASAARERVAASIESLSAVSPSTVSTSDIAELRSWVDRLESEVRSPATAPRITQTAIILTGVAALGIAAFIA